MLIPRKTVFFNLILKVIQNARTGVFKWQKEMLKITFNNISGLLPKIQNSLFHTRNII